MNNQLTQNHQGGLLAMLEAAKALAKSPLLPEHLRGVRKGGNFRPFDEETVAANVLLVSDAAQVFGIESVFMLAKSSFVIGSSLDFDGKVYAALANQSGFLESDLNYQFLGEKMDRRVVVTGTLKGETEPRVAELHITTALAAGGKSSSPEWQNNPDQQLCYAGARQWVRRHLSKVLLGFGAPDELEAVTVAPVASDEVARIEEQVPTRESREVLADLNAATEFHQVQKVVMEAKGRRGLKDHEREEILEKARVIWAEMLDELFMAFDQRLQDATDRNEILQVMADVDDSELGQSMKKELADRAKVLTEGVA